uniref:Uncharacterized protein n=1 Tax=Anguilla anguilla TaxID=7936 RepID=A0A0E9QRB7_ANGAN
MFSEEHSDHMFVISYHEGLKSLPVLSRCFPETSLIGLSRWPGLDGFRQFRSHSVHQSVNQFF